MRFRFLLSLLLAAFFCPGVISQESSASASPDKRSEIETLFQGKRPSAWGEHLEGIRNRFPEREEKIIALTLDACGGKKGRSFDAELISFLTENGIPATLFVTSQWIDTYRDNFIELAQNPLFEIANHGTRHRPLSVTGRSVYGIRGTANLAEVIDEVEGNARKIEELTGKKPRWFRSGTAYYDDIAVQVVSALGYRIAGYRISGDLGGTATSKQVKKALLSARPGDIVLCHMNRPFGGTRKGLCEALPLLLERGFRFVTLSELK